MISVDQLRGDLLERYAEVFTGGLARAAAQGYSFPGTSHAHAVTHTAAGHATLSTGVFPSRSGIVANSWTHRTRGQWRPMYAVEDPESPIVGVAALPGRSPKNLLRGGLADWVLAADDDARVVSVSGKDRAAITMAGQAPGHVYWVNQLLARFVTSRHYRSRYPGWVNDFNEDVMPMFTADTVWQNSVPEAQRGLARADSADYEYDAVHTTMPHWAHQERMADEQSQNSWALAQPRMDAAVIAFAKVAIDELDLGQRDHTDYLAVSLSATDYVGHGFGPLSQEQLDNLVRLDKELGSFFDYLDEEVGANNWVAALTADHGVLTMPEYLAEQGEIAERVLDATRRAEVSQVVQEIAQAGGPQGAMADKIAAAVEESGLVAKAYTHMELTRGEPADSFATLYRNSHIPGRATGWLSHLGVEIRFDYQDLVSRATGTTHGSPYWYDRHVPLIFMGRGVSPGSSAGRSYTVDVAPTLAALAGIPYPDDLDGRAIYPPIF
jgi:predicted AlkP superfamily pyrophosphatase or phosphodiesterase